MRHVFKFKTYQFGDGFNPHFPDVDFQSDKEDMDKAIAIVKDRRDHYLQGKQNMFYGDQAMADLINLSNGTQIVRFALARGLAKTHRTIQQDLIGQILGSITAYLEWAKENNQFDARNEAVVNMADDLRELMEKHPLPFV